MLGDKTGEDMKIFSGNANPDLAREIAAYLGTQVRRRCHQPFQQW